MKFKLTKASNWRFNREIEVNTLEDLRLRIRIRYAKGYAERKIVI